MTFLGVVAELNIKMNSPPHSGNCSISPTNGVYLETAFNIQCDGFMDENVPLQYSFYAATGDSSGTDLDNLLLLAHDTNARATNVYFPYNPSGADVVVVINVTDSQELGSMWKIQVPVALPHATEYPELLRSLISGNESLMKRRKAYGDDQGAVQLQLVVLFGLLENQFPDLQLEDIKDLRNAISSVLAEVRI